MNFSVSLFLVAAAIVGSQAADLCDPINSNAVDGIVDCQLQHINKEVVDYLLECFKDGLQRESMTLKDVVLATCNVSDRANMWQVFNCFIMKKRSRPDLEATLDEGDRRAKNCSLAVLADHNLTSREKRSAKAEIFSFTLPENEIRRSVRAALVKRAALIKRAATVKRFASVKRASPVKRATAKKRKIFFN